MGGINSGSRIRNKLGVYKIYGLIDSGSSDYWFIGLSRSYLTNVKHRFIYLAKNYKGYKNKMYKKIRELGYKFDIVHLESLPVDMSAVNCRLYMQKNYLSKIESLNSLTYTNVEYRDVKKHLPKSIKIEICKMYKDGYNHKEIADKLNIDKSRIQNVLRTNNSTKKDLYNRSLELFKSGKTIYELKKENKTLSPYLIKKIKSNESYGYKSKKIKNYI